MASLISEARAWGRALIPRMVAEGMGATQAYKWVTSLGPFYRRQDFLADYRSYTGRKKKEAQVRSLGPDQKPTPYHMFEDEHKQPYKYKIFGNAKYVNKFSGEIIEKDISWYSDEKRGIKGWINEYIDTKDKKEYKPFLGVIDIEVSGITHDRRLPY